MKQRRGLVLSGVCSLLIVGLFVGVDALHAQEVSGDDVVAQRAQLEAELQGLEAEIEVQQSILQNKQRETVSLERDIAIFNSQINSAELSIRARNLVIGGLKDDIGEKSATIAQLNDKLAREKKSLGQLLRKTREIDSYSLVEVILGTQNLSDFFRDIDSFSSIKAALKESFDEIEVTKRAAREEQEDLLGKQAEEEELRRIQELQKRRVLEDKREKDRILDITKGEEERYQTILDSKKRSAASIRSQLFALRGSDAIPFEQALEYANWASEKTGVRPALILGIIKNESRLGEFIGTGTWREDMHPERDRPIFLDITARLGFDPDAMPVSAKPWYGWGGAMGPAQFIPSTWVLYEKRLGKILGVDVPNPWNPQHAFMASAMLLADNGAKKGGFAAERLAALRYFAGWKNATKPAYAFYGDDVMRYAEEFQELIDILKSS